MTTWRYATSTDVGLVREINEDCIFANEQLAIVADGMGGHAAGEIASEIAIKEVLSVFGAETTSEGLVHAVDVANRSIMADADANPSHLGMGTTVVAIGLITTPEGSLPVVINVGDSRAYQLRDGAMRQITADHSVAEEWVRQGRLTPEEAAVHPRRHQLTRTLGIESGVRPDTFPLAATVGDRILLCSDGLSNELSDDQIAEIASAPRSLDEAVAMLVAEANIRGGRDNISVVLLEFTEPTAQPHADVFAEAAAGVQPARVEAESAVTPRTARKKAKKARRLTWRSGVFVVLLLGALAGTYVVLDWFATSSYYLASHSPTPGAPADIAVFEGQPGGLLWFKPQLVIDTPYLVSQLTPTDRARLATTISEPSTVDAVSYATYLHHLWELGQGGSSTSTTTTTTRGKG